ncbi:MAG TPA: DUF58 domain-containing protein [Candidatus Binatia bacterium]|jgi:uncharacterized protein (DUF58 family)|nr:DUF58 domain-containing protein [Candidatus Binatia bacterium]
MLSREQLKTVRKIQIRTSHLVTDLFAGQYQSVFKGRGMEFAEVRLYQPGDEVRTIDWNVTARTGVPHVKRYAEERELTVMLLVDASASTVFGSVRQTKAALAAELGALLAFSAITNNDKVGLVIFSDRIEKAVPPRKGTRHVLRVIREVLSVRPLGRGTDIAAALEHLGRVTKRRAVVFVLSDFLDPRCRQALRLASRRHDVIAVVLDDPREATLPDVGLVELEEAESGTRYVVDTGSARVREAFAARAAAARTERDRMLRACDVDAIGVATDRPYAEALLRFFRMRERRQ